MSPTIAAAWIGFATTLIGIIVTQSFNLYDRRKDHQSSDEPIDPHYARLFDALLECEKGKDKLISIINDYENPSTHRN